MTVLKVYSMWGKKHTKVTQNTKMYFYANEILNSSPNSLMEFARVDSLKTAYCLYPI